MSLCVCGAIVTIYYNLDKSNNYKWARNIIIYAQLVPAINLLLSFLSLSLTRFLRYLFLNGFTFLVVFKLGESNKKNKAREKNIVYNLFKKVF